VPGEAPPHDYNYVLLAFWSCNNNPADMAGIWADAYQYFGQGNKFGNNTADIQKALKKKYNDAGVKILVSAFGATEFPTSAGKSASECGEKLGNFVLNNHLDGADIDWEDNTAMEKGTGMQWLIEFTKVLKARIPNHILTHAPQAPYFSSTFYNTKAYVGVHEAVGHLIDFYLVQFYNQVESKYDSYNELFIHATGPYFNGTAVKEIAAKGIPLNKIVVGKPILPSDASNTGWISSEDLGKFALEAYNKLGWYAGIMYWQYPSDKNGTAISTSAGKLIKKCKADPGHCV
jgi:chitinase